MPTFRAEGPGGLHGPVLVVLCDPGVGGGRARPDRAVTLGSLCPLWAGLCSPTPALLGLRDPVSSGEGSEQRCHVRPPLPRLGAQTLGGAWGHTRPIFTQVRAVGTSTPVSRQFYGAGQEGGQRWELGLLPSVTHQGSWPSPIKRRQ